MKLIIVVGLCLDAGFGAGRNMKQRPPSASTEENIQGEEPQFTQLKKGKLHLSIFPLQPNVLECEGGDLTQIQ